MNRISMLVGLVVMSTVQLQGASAGEQASANRLKLKQSHAIGVASIHLCHWAGCMYGNPQSIESADRSLEAAKNMRNLNKPELIAALHEQAKSALEKVHQNPLMDTDIAYESLKQVTWFSLAAVKARELDAK